ncbi:NADH dehydrogenase [ubiquinone] 1 alpha subcomplex subunit 10, mitochondrial [Danio rerio]|uniref:NADH dehydrogenase [ubiquinone] 1 alpha subcomplex subunit 10, mitochondrial n=2 Tax=Bilateria TaxID=33213 RepID=Q6PBM0_DANRE|nr:NADH dehydrogenase [ubiquinone] 1 alpha subcomplex subunit 10, mitochondrial [Danio rerio]AAH59660.1 NADH dehydrogenase (ubiquinone) 1 alpha subcomplex, 10 [Danio rerio]|eukprot:NP_955872.1 NADH dehydrogenase [ubiquinone] 1 alpha subcomplex subunit 10, mitochondrial [Danio rerio]
MALRFFRLVVPSGAAAWKPVSPMQTAKIHTSAVRNLRYGWLAYVMGERASSRFKENSKIISIDGNLASGKGVLAQELAEKLGMLYMPEPDTHYVDKMTKEKVPLDQAFNGNCSLEKFYLEPKASDGNSYRLQAWMYLMRLLQYSDAVEHLLTTGQGVILERSPFSDVVFLEAMFKEGYIRKQCVNHYNEIKGISICEFLPPHLVIYVDSPAEEVQKKLKASGKPYLQNVPLSYLKSIETAYKKTFLPKISEEAEVLTYGAVEAQDVEKVVEDIECLKFQKGPWVNQNDVSFHHMRMLVEDKQRVTSLTSFPSFIPEITIGAHELDSTYYAFKSLPGKRYAEGYNEDVGDKGIWLK